MADTKQNTEVNANATTTLNVEKSVPKAAVLEGAKTITPEDIDAGRVPQFYLNYLAQKGYEAEVAAMPNGGQILARERQQWLGRFEGEDWKKAHEYTTRGQELADQYQQIIGLQQQGFDTTKLEEDFYNNQSMVDHMRNWAHDAVMHYEKSDIGPLVKFFENFSLSALAQKFIATSLAKNFGDLTPEEKAKSFVDAIKNSFSQQTSFTPAEQEFLKGFTETAKSVAPVTATAQEILTDPANWLPIGKVFKGTTIARTFWKNFGFWGAYGGALDYAKHSGDEGYTPQQSILASGVSGAFGGLIGIAAKPLGELWNKTIGTKLYGPREPDALEQAAAEAERILADNPVTQETEVVATKVIEEATAKVTKEVPEAKTIAEVTVRPASTVAENIFSGSLVESLRSSVNKTIRRLVEHPFIKSVKPDDENGLLNSIIAEMVHNDPEIRSRLPINLLNNDQEALEFASSIPGVVRTLLINDYANALHKGVEEVSSQLSNATRQRLMFYASTYVPRAETPVPTAVRDLLNNRADALDVPRPTIPQLLENDLGGDEEAINEVLKESGNVLQVISTAMRDLKTLFTFPTYAGRSTDMKVILRNLTKGLTRVVNGEQIPIVMRHRVRNISNIQSKHTITLENPLPNRHSSRSGVIEFDVANGAIYHINAKGIGEGNFGSLMYHAIATWAEKNKLKIDLSGGFTSSSVRQRPIHMLSDFIRNPNLTSMYNALRTNLPYIGTSTIGASNIARMAGAATDADILPRTIQSIYNRAIQRFGSVYSKFSFDFEKGLFTYEGKAVDKQDLMGALTYEIQNANKQNVTRASAKEHRIVILTKALVDAKKAGHDITKLSTQLEKALTADVDKAYPFSQMLYVKGVDVAAGATLGANVDLNGDGKIDATDMAIGALGAMTLHQFGKAAWKTYERYAMNKKLGITPAAREAYVNARKETVDRLVALREELIQRRSSVTFEATRRELDKQIQQINVHLTNIDKLKGLDSFLASFTDKKTREYFESKSAPLVQVSEEKAAQIGEAIRNGDHQGTAELVDFNIARIDTEQDIIDAIEATSKLIHDETQGTTRGVVSFAEIQEHAQSMNISIEGLNGIFQDTRMLAERFTAARILLLNVTKEALEIANRAKEGVLSDVDRLEFHRLLSVQAGIQAQLKGSQTEIARATAAMRISSKINQVGTNQDLQKILKQLDANGQLDDAMRKYLASSEEMRNAMSGKITQVGVMDVINELFINSILSGVKTHLTNVSANVVLAVDGLAEGLVKSQSFGEGKAVLYGWLRGWKEALGYGWKAFKSDDAALDVLDKIEVRRAITGPQLLPGVDNKIVQGIVNTIGTVVRLPGRFLTAEDEFFKAISYRMRLHQLAYRKAKMEAGTAPINPNRIDEIMEEVATWKEAQVAGPNQQSFIDMIMQMDQEYTQGLESIYKEAIGEAKYRTFTNDLGDSGRSVQHFLYSNPGARLIVPFVRTPINIMKYFGARIPVVNLMFEKWVAQNPKEATKYSSSILKALTPGERLTVADIDNLKEYTYRTLVGSTLLYAGYEAAQDGKITGGIPSKNVTMKEAGWQPYSIRIGDKWYSYQRSDPYAMFIGTAADVYGITSVEDKPTTLSSEIFGAAAVSVTNNFIDKQYISGLADLMEVLTSEEQSKFEQWGHKMATSAVPAAVKQFADKEDPIQRDVKSMVDAFKAKIPGKSQELMPKYDYRGREKLKEGDPFIPFFVNKRETDKLDNEVQRLKLNFESLDKGLDGTELTPEQYAYMSKTAGDMFNEQATKIVNSPRWDKLSENQYGMPGGKTNTLQKLMMTSREYAKKLTIQHFPELKGEYVNRKRVEGEVIGGRQITVEQLQAAGVI